MSNDVRRWIPTSDRTFATEEESAKEFDERIGRLEYGPFVKRSKCSGPFEAVFVEVNGYYLAHRPGREQKNARIDRILIPGPQLKEHGWTAPIGVELKKSDADFGAAVSQAIDYTYCVFNVGNYWLCCERIFLWPFDMPGGPVQSVMLQNGIGAVHGRYPSKKYPNVSPDQDVALDFRLERNNLLIRPDRSIVECYPWVSGRKVGSR